MLRKLCLSAAVLAAALPALADESGQQEYMVACAVCHGESGLGDGPMAQHLNIAVPGLTKIAADNDGEFPFLDVLMIIDGRTGVRGHGSEMMPIWGDRFKVSAIDSAGVYGAETVVRGRILSLAYYVESLQE